MMMKTMMQRAMLTMTVTVALAITVACSDDDETKRSTQEILKAHEWQLVAGTFDPAREINPGEGKITDYYAELSECHKDDYVVFANDSVSLFFSGITPCWESEPDTTDIQPYTLSGNILNFIDASLIYTITSINENEMTWVLSMTENDTLYTMTSVYEAR